MANIEIKFMTQDGAVFSDIPSLTVVNREMFTVTSHGGAASLVFSPDLAAAVSPRPQSPMTLADGASAAFTFTSSAPAGYFIAYGPAGQPIIAEFPPERSNILYLQTAVIPMPPPPAPFPEVVATAVNSGPVINPRGAD